MARSVPGVFCHPDVVLELVVERRARTLLNLRVKNPVLAAVIALLAVEVAVDRLCEERVDDLVFVLLRDQNVDVELGPEASDALHELQRRHLLLGAFLIEGVELVVDHDGLEIAVLLDRRERFARRGDPGKRDAERIIERAGGRVQPFDEFLEHERLVVDDEDPADRFFHGTVREYRIVASSRRGSVRSGRVARLAAREREGAAKRPGPGCALPGHRLQSYREPALVPRCFVLVDDVLVGDRSEEHTSELQSLAYLVCRLLLEKKKKKKHNRYSVNDIHVNYHKRKLS